MCPRKETSQNGVVLMASGDGGGVGVVSVRGAWCYGIAMVIWEGGELCSGGMSGTVKWLARNEGGLLLCKVYKERTEPLLKGK